MRMHIRVYAYIIYTYIYVYMFPFEYISDSQTLHTRHTNLFLVLSRFSLFFPLVNATTIFNGKEPIWPLTQRHLMDATKIDL